MAPEEAVAAYLPLFFGEPAVDADVVETFKNEVRESIAWITWADIAEVVVRQLEVFRSFGHLDTVERLAESVVRAVRWHA